MFSCGEKENNTEDSLSKEIIEEMIEDGYTGKGTATHSNGNKYVGEWKDGKFNGQGALTFDGGQYVGEWKDDVPNGQGKMTYLYGNVEEGLWGNGEFLGE